MDTAVDVAKDVASIVLVEKDLGVLMEGLRLGRRTFASTLKYLFVTTSTNFGKMASMAAATLFPPFLPLLLLQIRVTNFLTDLPGTTIATDAVDRDQLQHSVAWDLRFLRNFMIVLALTLRTAQTMSSTSLTIGVLRRSSFQADETLFRSSWFLESVATELAVMLVLRTRRPCFRSRLSATGLPESADDLAH